MFWGFVWFLTKTQISVYSRNPDYSQVQIQSYQYTHVYYFTTSKLYAGIPPDILRAG